MMSSLRNGFSVSALRQENGEKTQQLGRSFDRFQSALCRSHVLFQQEVVETQQIDFRLRREADLVAFHRTRPRVAWP